MRAASYLRIHVYVITKNLAQDTAPIFKLYNCPVLQVVKMKLNNKTDSRKLRTQYKLNIQQVLSTTYTVREASVQNS